MRLVWPGSGRITVALLAVVPAAMSYPWHSTTQRWALGIAVAVVILLFGWWRGLHFTTIVRRRFGLLGRRRSNSGSHQLVAHSGADARTTAVLRVLPDGDAELPVLLIAGYLDRYGLRCESVRITSRDTISDRDTWIGLTMSAADNLAALRARSAQIPLRETAEVVLRRLADHLRENGCPVTTSEVDIYDVLGPQAKERWRAVEDGTSGFIAAYDVTVDQTLPDTLTQLWAQQATEVWTTVQISQGSRLAVACAVRSDEMPGRAAPPRGLISRRGAHRAALDAIVPDSTDPLGPGTAAPDLLATLRWPVRTSAAAGTG